MTLIKNCGLRTAESIHEAARSGASFVGFVHHLASPRHVSIEQLRELSAQVPDQMGQVIVLVDPSNDLLDTILAEVRPHYLQLHRMQKPERIFDITERTGIPVITGMSIRGASDLSELDAFEAVSDHLLFDAFHPHHEGGSGQRFDWSLLNDIQPRKPWFLAGGLTAENVAEAIAATGAPMVDVSSGIEEMPGVKSLEKIAAFNRAVLHARHHG